MGHWGKRGRLVAAALASAALFASAPASADAEELHAGDVYARVTATEVVLGNSVAERRWSREALATTALTDKRGGGRTWGPRRDFTLSIGGAEIGSESFHVTSVALERLPRGGMRATMRLESSLGAATRSAEVYPGIAGFRTRTTLLPAAPLALSAATLDEAAAGPATATIHAFRAGGDWRGPDWRGPELWVGFNPAGDWRASQSGAAVDGPAQWLSLAAGGRTLFMVMERNDLPSSRASYGDGVGALRVDYARDVVSLGPIEETLHVESPSAGRPRTLPAGRPFALEAAFTGFGDHDGDEAWQFHRYLTEQRMPAYPRAVTFNSNGVDDNRISTGAKDDMNLANIERVAPVLRRLGVETFVLDDGWQAVSGDWQPDSPQYPEPRWDGQPGSKFAPRFPDARFEAVRRAIAPMRLGLWMSPADFNPASRAYREHPQWACSPLGQATAAANAFQPESGSNEAGIGAWGPDAFPYVESRIRDAIENWGVTYFKFDFMIWLDCAGQGDLHDYHDAFVAMIDRLQQDHPGVTFQIDETNDYRLFPFDSVTRGPTWFQNGTPGPERLLHNIWDLSPYVPAFALGQHFLGGEAYAKYPVATLMAAALPSHMTYFGDPRKLPAQVVDAAAPWIRFYKRHRPLFGGVVYPLLDDPEKHGWTALQSWDPDRGRGALLAFRQDADASAARIALRNVPPHRRFDLFRAPDGRYAGTVSSAQLTRGIGVSLAAKRAARVLLIVPAESPRLELRLRCDRRAVTVEPFVAGGPDLRLRRAEYRAGRRVVVARRAPFARVLRGVRGGRVTATATLRDGRAVHASARVPRGCARRGARFAG